MHIIRISLIYTIHITQFSNSKELYKLYRASLLFPFEQLLHITIDHPCPSVKRRWQTPSQENKAVLKHQEIQNYENGVSAKS